MQEIVLELQNIAGILNSNDIPVVITYLSALGPLIVSVFTAIWAWKQHKQNQKLQKDIHNREVRLQSRDNILQIYNSFCAARKYAGVSVISLADTFAEEKMMRELSNKVSELSRLLYETWLQAQLFFRKSNPEFLDALDEHYDKYLSFCEGIVYYIANGEAKNAMDFAWEKTKRAFDFQNRNELEQNRLAMIYYVELCYTDKVKEIVKLGNEFVDNMNYDKFERYFEKYLQIDELM